MKKLFMFVVAVSLALLAINASAQVATTGNITGTVTDQNGAAVPGANVTVSGPLGEKTTTADSNGIFRVEGLIPGNYTVKVSNTGFKTTSVEAVTVLVGKDSALSIKLQPGEVTATVTVTGAATVDATKTETSTNLNDQLFANIPVQRAVSGLFYLAPGTTDGLGGGKDNPSISGASALDNLYVADGVNITDSAFGGIGTFSRVYGALGTGINTSFIKEVQIKTAGFEPQYGQAEGGIVNIITQSGSREYHGAIYGYAQPKGFESTRKQPDDGLTNIPAAAAAQDTPGARVNVGGKLLHQEGYDFGADFGGYVPGARDKLFFFGSFNPSIRRDIVRGAEANANNLTNSGLRLIRGPAFDNRTRTYNYAGKVDWNINSNNTLAFSIFGDPSKTNVSSFRTLNIDNTTADSLLDYGTRNISLRYNGTLSHGFTLSASLGLGRTRFNESGFADLNQITDRRGADQNNIHTFTGQLPGRGTFVAQGLGFFEPTVSRTKRADFNVGKIAHFLGQHTFGVGYTFQRGNYDGTRDRSGPTWTVPDGNGIASNQTTNVQWRLRYRASACNNAACANPNFYPLFPVQLANGTTSLVPVRLQVIRAEFGTPSFQTYSNYHAAYGQDTWRFNKYITGLLGLRWETETMFGTVQNGGRSHYALTDNWAPRLGVTVDPTGKGKMKAYYNFGRFFEYLPLDLAERSLSSEQDWTGGLFLPDFTVNGAGQRIATINPFGTVNPILDAAHQIAPGQVSTGSLETFSPGTKLGFTDENTFGFEAQLPKNWTFSARYIYRNTKRIIEDAAILSPEAALSCDWPNCVGTGIVQDYSIVNPSSHLDAFTNLVPFVFNPTFNGAGLITNVPAGCATSALFPGQIAGQPTYFFQNTATQAVCFGQTGINPATGDTFVTPDGKPDGFPNAVRKYKALELELNRRFSNGWQAFFNWRIASLRGNYEGHLRNDNGQTDPGISSLFDFTAGDFNLLGDQFAIGPLNTDRRHIINGYGSYSFSKDRGMRVLNGLNVGLNTHFETGLPINALLAHPVYLNAGEVPQGGRGALGRTPNYIRFDVHADYSWRLTEKTHIKFVADFFNVFNSQKIRLPDENKSLTFDPVLGNPPNQDFLKPAPYPTAGYYLPFSMRLGLRFEF